jgi:parvulin-like peptidyl-prolyl isomerase
MNSKSVWRLAPYLLLLVCAACKPAVVTPVASTSAPPPPGATPGAPQSTALPSAPTATAAAADEIPLAALVNGSPIYLADYERELGQYEASLPLLRGIDPKSPEGQAELAEARAWILDWMITEELIVQAADQSGIVVTDEDVDAVMQEITEESGGREALDAKLAELGETYEIHREKERRGLIVAEMNQLITEGVPEVAAHVHARHILVDTQEEADRIHAQLEGGADFAELAKAYSQDPNTRDVGGDLDWFPKGILTVPEVEEAAFSLEPGEFSQVVPSLLGYHIVQVVERDPDRAVSDDNRRLLQERALQKWIEGLKLQADIQIFVAVTP